MHCKARDRILCCKSQHVHFRSFVFLDAFKVMQNSTQEDVISTYSSVCGGRGLHSIFLHRRQQQPERRQPAVRSILSTGQPVRVESHVRLTFHSTEHHGTAQHTKVSAWHDRKAKKFLYFSRSLSSALLGPASDGTVSETLFLRLTRLFMTIRYTTSSGLSRFSWRNAVKTRMPFP
jgi:hypothetical protein